MNRNAIATRAQSALKAAGIIATVRAKEQHYIIRWVRDQQHYEKIVPLENVVLWRAVATKLNELGRGDTCVAPFFIPQIAAT